MRMAVVFKYAAFLRVAAAHARQARGDLYGRVAFFAVILGVFSSLWHAVAEAGMPIAADPKALVWYLAVTEWIVLSAPPIHIDIQEAIRRGDIVCRLARPVSYAGAAFAEGIGLLLVRAPLLGATAGMCAFVFTGWTPPPGALLYVVPFGLAAAALLTALYLWLALWPSCPKAWPPVIGLCQSWRSCPAGWRRRSCCAAHSSCRSCSWH